MFFINITSGLDLIYKVWILNYSVLQELKILNFY